MFYLWDLLSYRGAVEYHRRSRSLRAAAGHQHGALTQELWPRVGRTYHHIRVKIIGMSEPWGVHVDTQTSSDFGLKWKLKSSCTAFGPQRKRGLGAALL